MKLTQPKKVMDIIHPPLPGMPIFPSVSPSDPVMRAVELMVKNNLSTITVTAHGSPVGHVQLTEALEHLGLKAPLQQSAAGTARQVK